MFNLVHNNKRLMQIVLALVTLPFAFWGIDSYQRVFNLANDIASVDDQKITEQEFAEALRQQQERMRSMLGRNYNPALFESPQMRLELLEGMVSQRLLAQFAVRNSITVDDDQLREAIGSIPAFQDDGRFSKSRYEAMVRAEGYSSASFEASLRRDLMMQQLTGALADSGMAPRVAARQVAQLRAQQREISEHLISAEPQLAQAKVAPEAVKAFYDGNPGRFQVPEEVRVEFLVLNADALASSEQIGADAVKVYYDANTSKFGEPEQRQASHILIAFKSGAGDAEKTRARERAGKVLAQLRDLPGRFAELAKSSSADQGSASKGGDVGYFSPGMMVRPFEEAAFRQKLNEIGGLVESDFGFHIIKVTGIKRGKMKSLADARAEIEIVLRRQQAAKRFAEAAESFSNLVYEQADSLKPAAEKFKLSIQQAGGITRQSSSVQLLNNPKVLAALFSDDSIRNRRNTEAIEVAQNTLVAARVTDRKAASRRPFEEVRGEIARQLARQEALEIARKRGAERLEDLRKGNAAAAGFGAARTVSRDNPAALGPEALSQIFRADASVLPAYIGVDSPNGYAIYRISRVIDARQDEARQRGVQTELGRMSGTQEFKSFLAGLRSDAKVEINKALLEKKNN